MMDQQRRVGMGTSSAACSSFSLRPAPSWCGLHKDIWIYVYGFTPTSDLAKVTQTSHVLSDAAQQVLLYSRKWWDIQKKREGWQRASRFDNVEAQYMPELLALQHQVTHVRFLFNHSVDKANLPTGLQYLQYGELPAGLKHLEFDAHFDQHLVPRRYLLNLRLELGTLPTGLQHLQFDWTFNQSLDKVALPTKLQHLELGYRFNQSLDKVVLPAGLQHLQFGEGFNQSLDKVVLPAGLKHLQFGGCFKQSLDKVKLPAGLQHLECGTYIFEFRG
jgi:hypothetical protein